MTSDPRIHRVSAEETIWLTSARERWSRWLTERNLDWPAILRPLLDTALLGPADKAGAVIPSPPDGLTRELMEAWSSVARRVTDRGANSTGDASERVLSEMLGAAIAPESGRRLEDWVRTLKILECLPEAVLPFADTIDAAWLRQEETALMAPPTLDDLADGLETYGPLNGRRDLKEFLSSAGDRDGTPTNVWTGAQEAIRDADYMRPRGSLWLRTYLLRRLGVVEWLAFVAALPADVVRAVVVNEVDALDEIERAIQLTPSVTGDEPLERRILTLLVLRAAELWTAVEASLAGPSGMGFDSPDAAVRRQRLAEWRAELEERATRTSTFLVLRGSTVGIQVAVLASQGLFGRAHGSSRTDPTLVVYPAVRRALVKAFAEMPRAGNDLLVRLLSPPTEGGLLTAATVFLQDSPTAGVDHGAFERLWRAYSGLLRDETFFWDSSLRFDDEQVAWAMAGVLSVTADAVPVLERTLEGIHVQSEGWNADYPTFLSSIQKLAHLLIVGAMAAEWCSQRKHPAGRVVFDWVWSTLDRWLRTLPEVHDGHVTTALVHVWARLPLLAGGEAPVLAIAALARLDRIEWVLEAGSVLKGNMSSDAGAPKLGLALQKQVWHKVVEQLPLFCRQASTAPAIAQKFHAALVALTPDVAHDDQVAADTPHDGP